MLPSPEMLPSSPQPKSISLFPQVRTTALPGRSPFSPAAPLYEALHIIIRLIHRAGLKTQSVLLASSLRFSGEANQVTLHPPGPDAAATPGHNDRQNQGCASR